MTDLALACDCGTVKGLIQDASPSSGNHLVCYCTDCQAFPAKLGCSDKVLNDCGGTAIFQSAANRVQILQGADNIRCLKLSEKGLHRWYAHCCNTPIANTLNANFPFVGVIHSFFETPQSADKVIGPILGSVHLNGATGKVPENIKGPMSSKALMFRVLRKLCWWKLSGKARPSPFYDQQGTPISPPTVAD